MAVALASQLKQRRSWCPGVAVSLRINSSYFRRSRWTNPSTRGLEFPAFCDGIRAGSSWRLPAVPESVRQAVSTVVDAQELVPREACLLESREEAEEALPDLLSARLVAVDCEGVALGRWGRLCLCQVATPEKVYLFDALRTGVMDVLAPALASAGVVKVMHDCREDASALLSQFNVGLENVFDTQVAHIMLLKHQDTRPYQISLNELLKGTLQLENEQQVHLGSRMRDDPNIWFYRPIHEDLTTYAAQDVMYLLLLHHVLCDLLGDPGGGRVLHRSRQYADYARMNQHLASPKAAERRGLRLQAMLATQTETALYLKLNLGNQRQGAVSRPEAMSRFRDFQVGDVIDCWVSAWNTTGNVLFLERLEPTNTFPEPKMHQTDAPRSLRRGGKRPRGQAY
eukprot:TRINITY_DN37893_c0_g1_i1.p1 TRINITY_DN37893_c0_g1~~TRINITY_DN37893_c0_g1_i1.p1  ORF type:complete len:398 (-),score=49.81 TRINITY_DN37893_c0_g1_i1:78-1271(-)